MASPPENETNKLITEYEWMIRPCEMYNAEYKDCISVKGRFHQYFIYGETIDCSQWKRDLDCCYKWEENKDANAASKIIKSEQVRRKERLRAHYANNIWEKRTEPPKDWNKPLPEYISKDYENSYLGIKSREMRGEVVLANPFTDRTFCAIL